jgi:hypothetical protein
MIFFFSPTSSPIFLSSENLTQREIFIAQGEKEVNYENMTRNCRLTEAELVIASAHGVRGDLMINN